MSAGIILACLFVGILLYRSEVRRQRRLEAQDREELRRSIMRRSSYEE